MFGLEVFFLGLVVSGQFHAIPHQYDAYMTTSCRSRCMSERIQMYIYWFLTNEKGITSARLVAIFSFHPLDRKPQRRLIFDDTGGNRKSEIFFYTLTCGRERFQGPEMVVKARFASQSVVDLGQ